MDNEKTISARNEFVQRLTDDGYTKERALEIYDIFIEILMNGLLNGQKIRLRNFGTFRLKYHNGHRSVRLGDEIDGYLMIKFRGASAFYRKIRSDDVLLEKIKQDYLTKKETDDDDETEDIDDYNSCDDDVNDSVC